MPNPAYPVLPILASSRPITRDGREEDEGSDGSMRVRKLHADKYDFEITHRLSSAQVTTLETFYSTYGTSAAIDFVWPANGATYVVRFGKGGLSKTWLPDGRSDVKLRLVGV